MLRRATRRLSKLNNHSNRLFSAPAAFDAYSSRVNKLKSDYPNLFDKNNFISDQQDLLNAYKSSIPSLLKDYNDARIKIDQATGENVFTELNENDLLNDINIKNQPFYNNIYDDDDDIAAKLSLGTEYVNNIINLQKDQQNATTIEAKNLKMIQISDYGDKIDQWMLTFPDKLNDNSDLGLPISDQEVDEWVKRQYHHAPDDVREQRGMSYDDHKKIEERWMMTLDDKLIDLLSERDPNFDNDKFRLFCDITNELFHPHNIDHYVMSNYAKSLFRAALWQSPDRCNSVEESIVIVSDLLQDSRDNDSSIMRGIYEKYPSTRFASFIAAQLQLTDPLFSAKLIEETRNKFQQIAIDRAIKDILFDLEMPYLKQERSDLEQELSESQSTNPVNMRRHIRSLKIECESYNLDLKSLENVLDELLPEKLWNNDIDLVKNKIIEYSVGKCKLIDIDNAIRDTLKPNVNQDISSLSDTEILDISVKFHNSRTSDVSSYNFNDFLYFTTQKKDLSSKLSNRRIVKNVLDKLNCDNLVVNLCRILIEDGKGIELEKICTDYLNIMKRYRGEIDGSITSYSELSDDQYNQIETALSQSNPGKKITLQKYIDPGLQSGFIIKAGVQRFDFSLATVIHQGRIAVGSG